MIFLFKEDMAEEAQKIKVQTFRIRQRANQPPKYFKMFMFIFMCPNQ